MYIRLIAVLDTVHVFVLPPDEVIARCSVSLDPLVMRACMEPCMHTRTLGLTQQQLLDC